MRACGDSSTRWYLLLLALILTLGLSGWSATAAENNSHGETPLVTESDHGTDGEDHSEGHGGHANLGKALPLWSIIPFVGILLSIALLPLIAPSFWHHHFPKISIFWAVLFALPFLIAYKGDALYEILHIYLIDYIPFIILLWGLFTVSGGILLRGTLRGTPAVNTLLLLVGTLLASWMGTTGASMLLIRPMIRANSYRKNKTHVVVFFIFLVSNIGGSLTPLGDPPLFLGFLHGVPFFWTFKLLPHMIFVSVILLILFFILDSVLLKREGTVRAPEDGTKEPLKLEGTYNFVFLAGIVGAVLMSGLWKAGDVMVLGVHMEWQNILRDVLIVGMGLLSLKTTPMSGSIRRGNEFTWFPIQEVAYLFAGIFMTIVPALAILKAGTEGALAFVIEATKTPPYYFWITGGLSSFLDNAPTYLTFFNTALGQFFPGMTEAEAVPYLTGQVIPPADLMTQAEAAKAVLCLMAISAGAVFMGAMTYIGNAPNFMVRSIAEESGVKMPSFFGYMAWSAVILIPLYVVVSLIFF